MQGDCGPLLHQNIAHIGSSGLVRGPKPLQDNPSVSSHIESLCPDVLLTGSKLDALKDWDNVAPIAMLGASVCKKKVLEKSGGYKTGYDVSLHFSSSNKT
jgi:hypothetical protein